VTRIFQNNLRRFIDKLRIMRYNEFSEIHWAWKGA